MAKYTYFKTIAGWRDWIDYLDEVYKPRDFGHRFLFRGQPSTTNERLNLKPSILRAFEERKCLSAFRRVRLERRATIDFLQDAHLYPDLQAEILTWIAECTRPGTADDAQPLYPPEIESRLPRIWAAMQHNMAVTRLLDWTASPYAAMYFAVRESLSSDAAVWCVCERSANQARRDVFGEGPMPLGEAIKIQHNGEGDGRLYFFDLPVQTKRSTAQQAYISICDDICKDHAEVLAEYLGNKENVGLPLFHVVRIPAAQKAEFMRMLRACNISGKTIFPDAQGLGMSARELVCTHRENPTEPFAYDARG